MHEDPNQTSGVKHLVDERLRRDLPSEDIEAALGPPDAVIRTTGGARDHAMWAYQRQGVYLYFNAGRLVAWRTYPHGCDDTPSLSGRSQSAAPDEITSSGLPRTTRLTPSERSQVSEIPVAT